MNRFGKALKMMAMCRILAQAAQGGDKVEGK